MRATNLRMTASERTSDSLERDWKRGPVGTEEDGVDEAVSRTQSPFVVTPQVREADVELAETGAVVDNDSMVNAGHGKSNRKPTDETVVSPAVASETEPFPPRDRTPTFTPASAPSPSPAPPQPAAGSPGPRATAPAAPANSAPYSGSPYREPYREPAYQGPANSGSAPTSASTGYSGTGYPGADWSAGRGSAAPAGSPAAEAGADAGALSGAAAGLAGAASSVTSAWQNRGASSKEKKQRVRGSVRRSSKRQAMLTLARVEPWSVMKFSFVASVVAFIILFVAIAVLYMVLSMLGVFDSLQHTVSTVTSSQGTTGTNISHYFSASLILGYTAMLGALNIVLITAISTVGSVIYNLIAKTVGGIEVTLRETD